MVVSVAITSTSEFSIYDAIRIMTVLVMIIIDIVIIQIFAYFSTSPLADLYVV
jgi:hypothetical protein